MPIAPEDGQATPRHPRKRLMRLHFLLHHLPSAILLVAGLSPRVWLGSACAADAETVTNTESAHSKADSTPVEMLFRSIRKGDPEGVAHAIAEGADVNAHRFGLTAWITAKQHGFEEIANELASQGADTSVKPPPIGSTIERFLGDLFNKSTPACSVLVSRDGTVIAQSAFGVADIKKKVPASTNSKFLIGSVTKQFTAAAILRLQQDGKLNVEDKLSKFLPDFPRGETITLHHLLTHTSGIVSYTSKPDFMATVHQATTEKQLVDSFKDDPPMFAPGEKFAYCNSGYFLLGHIIGKVSGVPFAEYLRTTFFEPLAMDDTAVYDSDRPTEDLVIGYSYIDEAFETAQLWHMSRAGAAGALVSTVGDLNRWNEAVFGPDHKVLSQASLDAAFAPTTLNDGTKSDYGYGWQLGSQRGVRALQHTGGLQGFLSALIRYPDAKVNIVVLMNAMPNGNLPPPQKIATSIGEQVLWQQMQPRTSRVVDKTVDPDTLKDFVGQYDYGSPSVLDVTLEGGQLFAQLSGQKKLPIYPRNATTFFWKIVDAEVEFVRDDSGVVVEAIHRQNGRTSRNKRLPTQPVVELSKDDLQAFVGKYDYGGPTLIVTRDGKQLLAQLTGQDAYKIYPESDTTFAWHAVDAHVEFVKDDQGNVIKAIHTQGGRTFDAPRIKPVKAIRLDPDKLDDYVGRYNYGFLAGTMVITREGNRLMAKLRGQPKFEIVPVGPDEFKWKDINASIKFVRDETGQIAKGLHTQAGNTITVPRVKEPKANGKKTKSKSNP